MRKQLETISLLLLAVMFWTAWRALAGPDPLPARIPTHFDAAGRPNGWGSPSILLFLPIMATFLYLFITVLSFFPALFNYPVRSAPDTVKQFQEITRNMICWIKLELISVFTFILSIIIRSARNGQGHLSPLMGIAFPLVILTTVGWYMVAMFRVARSAAASNPDANQLS